jgi:hypothetical protein
MSAGIGLRKRWGRETLPLAGRIAQHRAPVSAAHRGWLAELGPGLITGASDDDPSGIATYSQAGAQFGTAMCWVMLFTWPLMAAIQEISARIGRVTGHGIAANIRAHYPPWLLRSIVALLLIANTLNLGADLGAMGAAVQLLIGGPPHLYVICFAIGCALLETFSRYERYVHFMKWTSVSLLAYVATAFVVQVPWRQVVHDTFLPNFLPGTNYVVTIVAVLGTTITPYCFFWQSSQEAEDEQIDPHAEPLLDAPQQAPREIGRIRYDTYIGMGYSNLISLFIIITTAATLHAAGVTDIQTSAQGRGGITTARRTVRLHDLCDWHHRDRSARGAGTGWLGSLCVGRGAGLANRAGAPAAGCKSFLCDDRHFDAGGNLHQLHPSRPDQSAVLVGGAERDRRGAADGGDYDHGDAAQGDGAIHVAMAAVGAGLGLHSGNDDCSRNHVRDRVARSL